MCMFMDERKHNLAAMTRKQCRSLIKKLTLEGPSNIGPKCINTAMGPFVLCSRNKFFQGKLRVAPPIDCKMILWLA